MSSIYRFLKEEKAKAFHVVSAPKITELNRENRLSFCEYLRDWDEDDFLHLPDDVDEENLAPGCREILTQPQNLLKIKYQFSK